MNSNEFIELLKLFEEASSNASDNIKAYISELRASAQHQDLNNKMRKVAEDVVKEAKKKYPKITDNKPKETKKVNVTSHKEESGIITRRMYNEICNKLPIFKACTTLMPDDIKSIYDFINTYKVTDKPAATCGNTDVYRKFIFHSNTPNDCSVCMCVDMGPMYQCEALHDGYNDEHGMHINFTISAPAIMQFKSVSEITKILNENSMIISNMRISKVDSQDPYYINYEISLNADYCELCDRDGKYRLTRIASKIILAIMKLFMTMNTYIANLDCHVL